MPSQDRTAANETLKAPEGVSLLRLPAEIRNEIYRFALIKSGGRLTRVDAGTSWAAEPPILHVCHQIRNEAIALYYQGNKFMFKATDCDAGVLIAWQSMSERKRTARTYTLLTGAPSWTSLKRWLQVYREGRASRLVGKSSTNQPYRTAVVKIFDFVDHMRNRRRSWMETEAALEKMHDVMAALDPAWQ